MKCVNWIEKKNNGDGDYDDEDVKKYRIKLSLYRIVTFPNYLSSQISLVFTRIDGRFNAAQFSQHIRISLTNGFPHNIPEVSVDEACENVIMLESSSKSV